VVKEPSKARSITKGQTCTRIVVDVVSKICHEVLKKAFPSSYSGMAASDHPWRLFNSFFTEEFKDLLFSPSKTRTEELDDGRILKETTYRDVFCSSTDYKDATNSMPMPIARELATYWMHICGIPVGL